MLTYVLATVQRFLGFYEKPAGQPSAVSAGEMPITPGYPTMSSMSALAAFPYVRACVTAIAYDLAGLPLIAVEVDRDGIEHRVPLSRYLPARPNSGQTWRELRAQLYADSVICENAYCWKAGASFIRLHPALVVPTVDDAGLIRSYRYNNRMTLRPDEVLHVSGISWSDDARMLFGESPIRTLHDDLTASKAAKEQAAKAAKRGRPEWLLTPQTGSGAVGKISATAVKLLQDTWEEQLRLGKGALVCSEAVEAQPLSLSMRDMEYSALMEAANSAILAVFDVPPSRVGIPGANYATAKTEARRYWQGLLTRAQRFDDALTDLLGRPGVVLRHDFSKVEALQVSNTERMEQLKSWVEVGAKPHAAAVYVGFVDPPLAIDAEPRQTFRPPSAEEPDEPQGTRSLEDLIADSRVGYERAVRAGRFVDRRALDFEAMAVHLDLDRAADVAEAIYRSVADHLAECASTGAVPFVRGLACWTPAYAAALERHLEAA